MIDLYDYFYLENAFVGRDHFLRGWPWVVLLSIRFSGETQTICVIVLTARLISFDNFAVAHDMGDKLYVILYSLAFDITIYNLMWCIESCYIFKMIFIYLT